MITGNQFKGALREAELKGQLITAAIRAGYLPCEPLADLGVDLVLIDLADGASHFVQQKSRLTIHSKYGGRNIELAFPEGDEWFVIPHDDLVSWLGENTTVLATDSWKLKGAYSRGTLSKQLREYLEPYSLTKGAQLGAGRSDKWASVLEAKAGEQGKTTPKAARVCSLRTCARAAGVWDIPCP